MSTEPKTSPKSKEPLDDKTLLDFYWKYFDLHSRQRMQMINFYITVTVVLYGGLFALLQLEHRVPIAEYFIAGFMILISYCFRRLDRRTSELIHGCEDRIKVLESGLDPNLRLIENSEKLTANDSGTAKSRTYSSTFSILTFFVSASGVAYILLRLNEVV